jgi:hypothetical protein
MQEVVLSQGTNSLHSEILFYCSPLLKERGGVMQYMQYTPLTPSEIRPQRQTPEDNHSSHQTPSDKELKDVTVQDKYTKRLKSPGKQFQYLIPTQKHP